MKRKIKASFFFFSQLNRLVRNEKVVSRSPGMHSCHERHGCMWERGSSCDRVDLKSCSPFIKAELERGAAKIRFRSPAPAHQLTLTALKSSDVPVQAGPSRPGPAAPGGADCRPAAAQQHLLRHRPADGGQGPQRQRQLPGPLPAGQPAESHVGLLHGLPPRGQAGPHPPRAAPGPVGGPRVEESAHRGVPQRVSGGQGRPAAAAPFSSASGGDVRLGGCLRAGWGLLRLLGRRDDADVHQHHSGGALQGRCCFGVLLWQPEIQNIQVLLLVFHVHTVFVVFI